MSRAWLLPAAAVACRAALSFWLGVLPAGCELPAVGLVRAPPSPGISRASPRAAAGRPSPRGPVFYHAESSDDWVRHTIRVQRDPLRVLLVQASGAGPSTVRVPVLDLNARGAPVELRSLVVDKVFSTLQEAADAAQGGDLVAVAPGSYTGFYLEDKPGAGDGRYIHFRALGEPGEVVIDRPSPADGARWMIYLRAAHHVIIQGFNLKGAQVPGDIDAPGPWAGIMLDGAFGATGELAHHIVIADNFSHHHAAWGLHSTDTHSVLIQDNLFGLSAREHSAYVSDGSDDYVIRRNVFFGSRAGGLQCNLDPEASLQEVMRHPALRDAPPFMGTRAWSEAILARATALFGEHGFPDGRGVNFIIEDNVMNRNGRAGGGSLNLAGLQSSLIQNNLIYDNYNHGIAQWDNANPFDAASVSSPPQTPEQARAPGELPRWGCHGNVIRNNTVLLDNVRRAAVLIVNGSYGVKLRNNILINDADASMDVDRTSIFGLSAGYSVTNTVRYRDAPFDQQQRMDPFPPALWRAAFSRFESDHTTMFVTRGALRPELVRLNDEPWIVLEGGWWKLNPDRPDFRPRRGSGLLTGRGDPAGQPGNDLLGRRRRGADIGAFAREE